MKTSRLAALALFAAFSVVFSGCKTLPKTKTVSNTGQALTPESGAALTFRTTDVPFGNAVAEKFKQQYGVTVTTQSGGQYDFQKAVLEGASGKGPDVFMSPNDNNLAGVQAGLFLPLDDQVVQQLNQSVSPVALKSVTVGKKVYGVPVSIETYVLFYNKKLVTGKPVSTFEELAKQAKAYNNTAQNKFWFLFDASSGSPIFTALSTYGFNLFGASGTDNDHPGFDTPAFEKGLEVLRAYHDVVPVSSTDLGNTDFLNTQFIKGNTAYLLDGPWDVKTFRDAGVDLGATTLPTYDGHQQRSFAFIQNAYVSAYSKYPKAAQLFAQSLVSADNAQLLYEKANKITSRKDISDVKGIANDPVLSTVVKAFNTSVPMPSVKRISYFWSITADVGPAVFDGKMTPKDGVARAEQEWKTFVQTES